MASRVGGRGVKAVEGDRARTDSGPPESHRLGHPERLHGVGPGGKEDFSRGPDPESGPRGNAALELAQRRIPREPPERPPAPDRRAAGGESRIAQQLHHPGGDLGRRLADTSASAATGLEPGPDKGRRDDRGAAGERVPRPCSGRRRRSGGARRRLRRATTVPARSSTLPSTRMPSPRMVRRSASEPFPRCRASRRDLRAHEREDLVREEVGGVAVVAHALVSKNRSLVRSLAAGGDAGGSGGSRSAPRARSPTAPAHAGRPPPPR